MQVKLVRVKCGHCRDALETDWQAKGQKNTRWIFKSTKFNVSLNATFICFWIRIQFFSNPAENIVFENQLFHSTSIFGCHWWWKSQLSIKPNYVAMEGANCFIYYRGPQNNFCMIWEIFVKNNYIYAGLPYSIVTCLWLLGLCLGWGVIIMIMLCLFIAKHSTKLNYHV